MHKPYPHPVMQHGLCIPYEITPYIWLQLITDSGFPGGSVPMQEMWVWSLGPEDPLEKGMATHSSILDWKILWTEDPGGL